VTASQGGPRRFPSCDFCRDPLAPFGFAPDPRLGIPIRRPVKTCGRDKCQDQARAKVAALVYRGDYLGAARPQKKVVGALAERPLPKPAKVDQAQKSLF
jgi:hypothetical protein